VPEARFRAGNRGRPAEGQATYVQLAAQIAGLHQETLRIAAAAVMHGDGLLQQAAQIDEQAPAFSRKQKLTRMIHCVKLDTEAEGLDFPPTPGELGKRIYESVS